MELNWTRNMLPMVVDTGLFFYNMVTFIIRYAFTCAVHYEKEGSNMWNIKMFEFKLSLDEIIRRWPRSPHLGRAMQILSTHFFHSLRRTKRLFKIHKPSRLNFGHLRSTVKICHSSGAPITSSD